jgi:hypothetical protein
MANRFQEVQKSDATGLFFAPQKFSPLKLFSTFIGRGERLRRTQDGVHPVLGGPRLHVKDHGEGWNCAYCAEVGCTGPRAWMIILESASCARFVRSPRPLGSQHFDPSQRRVGRASPASRLAS